MAYTDLPLITTSTPAERLQALKDSRDILASKPEEVKPTIFGGGSAKHAPAPAPEDMLRLAEYITTGHDYKDTHPEGKRRPIQKHMHVTVMAGGAPSQEDIEHLLSHLKDDSFLDFISEQMRSKDDDSKDDGKADDSK